MEIRYRLQHADLEQFGKHLQARGRSSSTGMPQRIGVWALLGFAVAAILQDQDQADEHWYKFWPWILTAGIFLASSIWFLIWRGSRHGTAWLKRFEGTYTLAASSAGISHATPDGRVGFHAWPEIIAFETTDAYLYLYLRRDVAFSIPRSGSEDAIARFAATVNELWALHPENAGKPLPATPQAQSPLAAIFANLRAAARIVFFLPYDSRAFVVSLGSLFQLVLLDLLAIGLVDYIDALPAAEFNRYGLSRYFATTLLTLTGVAVISQMILQRASLLRLLVMVCSVQFIIHVLYFSAWLSVERFWPDAGGMMWAMFLAAVAWLMTALFGILRRMYRQPAPSALFLLSIYALFSFALSGLLPYQRLYYQAETADEAAASQTADNMDVEEVYYRQPALVGNALAELAPRSPARTDLYFVGFAGQAEEQVFTNEVSFARDLLDRRFQTAGRSLLLLNNAASVADTPLANRHNLEAVLQGMAERMDRQRDVLFLFLSSHGAQDQSLSVSFWPLGLTDLKAEQVKAMLDKAGIRNRIIVVSACYSGGFLDVLRDDDTLILTASSRDHVSYGCGDFTEYTYFGESYFVKALANGDSFIAAFEQARRMIEEREQSEGKEASGPQIHVGRNIVKILQNLQASARPAGDNGGGQGPGLNSSADNPPML
ncbi:C13 family peptidase [Methylomonas sp. SURF-2]|uniref:C13 family peptidase n=1 Tax=Methylomonas subterranea TaxID=2952225 RepID=A0ABT1TDW6_9GAMM|nr:C13 family peptidase [Methylomonas sp. SURF-2]MCQ8102964.1 C13 family peptidase [Methylomonas sp. SURF-2]